MCSMVKSIYIKDFSKCRQLFMGEYSVLETNEKEIEDRKILVFKSREDLIKAFKDLYNHNNKINIELNKYAKTLKKLKELYTIEQIFGLYQYGNEELVDEETFNEMYNIANNNGIALEWIITDFINYKMYEDDNLLKIHINSIISEHNLMDLITSFRIMYVLCNAEYDEIKDDKVYYAKYTDDEQGYKITELKGIIPNELIETIVKNKEEQDKNYIKAFEILVDYIIENYLDI